MATGKLQVEVYNSNMAEPMSSVNVRVLSGDEVLYDVFTDLTGRTELMELEAPPAESTITNIGEQPYATYGIEISTPGFKPIFITNAQIFADAIALQKVYLDVGDEAIVINVPPPVLWGDYPEKEPEDEVKPIPAESGFEVLDRVVIPEYVVVHDGPPGSNGAVYYVPYKDYIKNVASSEIYATWPDAAIRANVLAIQSFVLNRVFTEWYRNKGYNFTITNSTRTDQSYSQGRTIYGNISQIVDEMFTNYIVREGQIQPLFAQYCDGRKVTCPGWMTQWGSADLASQGYTAMEILSHFYGTDIHLETAERVQGVPQSYPGDELTVGSTGEPVRTIQRQLNAISDTYTAIPKLRVDGQYGEDTAEAVKAFQQIFNSPVTGVVDLATWYKISQLYVSIENLASM